MSHVFIYVVDRDFGFAPNPFHGYCTLATCKPGIRRKATIDDWIIGVGGTRLNATGRCVFAMRATQILTFNDYWFDVTYLDKRPVRNGSRKMMVGDNIYYYDVPFKQWHQDLPDRLDQCGPVRPIRSREIEGYEEKRNRPAGRCGFVAVRRVGLGEDPP